jgi:diguanylate cyclase
VTDVYNEMFQLAVLRRPVHPALAWMGGGTVLACLLASSATVSGEPTLLVPVLSLVTILVWVRRARESGSKDLWFWALGAAGMVAAFGGYLSMALGLGDTSPAVVMMFLTSYPLMMLCQFALIRSRALSMSFGPSLDGIIVSLLSGAVILHCISGVASTAEFHTMGLASKAYLVFDVLLLGSTINLGSAFNWRLPRQIKFTIAAQILIFSADLSPVFETYFQTRLGAPSRLAVLGYLLIIGAARSTSHWSAAVGANSQGPRVFVIAWVSTPPALALLVFPTVDWIPRLLAAGCVLLVVLRVSTAYGLANHQAALRQEARTDDLTSLPNRRALREHLLELTSRNAPFAVALMDLDDFKQINDSLGHEAGDQLLRTVSLRLLRAAHRFGGQVQIFRLGGDEFAATMMDPLNQEALALEVRKVVAIPVELEHERIEQEISIGFATFPTDANHPGELLRLADTAMYLAKKTGSGFERHANDSNQDVNPLRLMTILREALHEGTFELHYQPQIRLSDGSVFGVEALFRIEQDGAYLATDAVIAAARSAGMLRELTDLVIDRAFSDLSQLSSKHPNLNLSLNVSAQDIASDGLAKRLLPVLRRYKIDPARICVEVTEEALLSDPKRAAGTVQELRAGGVNVSMDDFGVGFSSLANLRSLDVDEIKIDRSFVTGMVDDRRTEALVLTIVDLARRLGARTVIEGVEQLDELTMARALGIDIAQGWVFARAMPLGELRLWLKSMPGAIGDFCLVEQTGNAG